MSGEPRPPEWREPWSIALIRQRYWGLPWWVPNLVLLGHLPTKKGAEYFIDGDRSVFRLSGFFPYVDFRCATRTRPVSEAGVEMRLLRDGPPKSGVRIIGRVMRRSESGNWEAYSGVSVKITGASIVTRTTDNEGIYDAVGLPPGHYAIRTDPDYESRTFMRDHAELAEGQLKDGDVWGRDVFVQ